MGFFGKDRTGSVETVLKGRRFVWRIAAIGQQRYNTVLDSDLLTSFEGIEFHFHLIIGLRGDVGFYVHHKRARIPKYSFYFQAGDKGDKMRQHTAHSIPQETERCGHWNVCSMEDIKRFLPHPNETLLIHFTFDNDVLAQAPLKDEDAAMEFQWLIPRPAARCLTPLCSASFAFNGVYYVIRVDEQGPENYCAFVFSRNGLVPPHSIQIADAADGTVVAACPKTEDMATQILKVDRAHFELDKVIVRVVMHRGGNPLDVLNMPNANFEAKPAAEVLHEDDERARKYGVAMMDDI